MSKVRFVRPATDLLTLSEGDWLKVKHELSLGDARTLTGAGFSRAALFTGDRPEVNIDWKAQGIARVMAYVVEWSFKDEQGRQVPVTEETVAALTQEAYAEIDAALDVHVEKVRAEKNAQKDETSPAPTSP